MSNDGTGQSGESSGDYQATVRARIAELEQRVLDGSDDRAYCLRWIAIHSWLLAANFGVGEVRG